MTTLSPLDRLDRLRTRLSIKHELGRGMLGEFMGLAFVTLIGTSVVAQLRLSGGRSLPGDTSPADRSSVHGVYLWYGQINAFIGWGLAYAFGYALARKLSGGHLNPAISLMFLSFRQITPLRFALYFLAQVAGAFVGAAIAYLMYFDAIHQIVVDHNVTGANASADIFASYPSPHLGRLNGVLDQVVSTAVFCFLFAHIFDRRNAYPNWLRPLLAGLAFFTIGIAFSLNCGFPDNPARDFGGRLFSLLAYGPEVFTYGNRVMNWWFWIPLLAPLIGALLGGWLYQVAVGFHSPIDDPDVEVRKYDVEVTQELKPLTTTKGVIVTETS